MDDVENGGGHRCSCQRPERWRTLRGVLRICDIGSNPQFTEGKVKLYDFFRALRWNNRDQCHVLCQGDMKNAH